jgi:hypothetical protein
MEENKEKYNEKKKNELEKIDKKYEKEREDCIKKKFDELKKDVNSNLIGIICALFENDGLNSDSPFILETDEKTLKNNPQDKPTNKIILSGGTNTIFCQDKPKSIKASNRVIMKLIYILRKEKVLMHIIILKLLAKIKLLI